MGIEESLWKRFGDAGLQRMPQIEEIYEEKKLGEIHIALITRSSLDEVRQPELSKTGDPS